MDVEQKLEELDAMYDSDDTKKKKGKAKLKKEKKETLADAEKVIAEKTEEAAPAKTLDELDAMYSDDDKKKKKSKGKKGGAEQKQQAPDAAQPPADGDEEQPGRLKTAAEKRKEKKEREKAKKATAGKTAAAAGENSATEQKKTEAEKESDAEPKKADAEPKKADAEPKKAEEAAGGVEAKENDTPVGADDDAKEMSAAKKKKLKKKEKEKEKKAAAAASESKPAADAGKKKPTSGVAKLIKQQLEKQKEEEERLRQQEEEAERKREEERAAKEELERIERERKEKRKAKLKERKQRLKDEGRLLTQKQKQDKQRLQQMLELKEVELPAAAAGAVEEKKAEEEKKKKPKYQRLKRNRGPAQGAAAAAEATTPTVDAQPAATEAGGADEAKKPEADDVPETWETWEAAADDTWTQMEAKEEWDDQADASGSSDEEDDDEDDSDDDDDGGVAAGDSAGATSSDSEPELDPMERANLRIEQRRKVALASASEDSLRCPLVCVLGHVDTGKTSILDKLRRTHVQDGEAGGITQQIGATNVPAEAILNATRMVKSLDPSAMILPGLLIIDTPGHESFSNLRSRGSSLCDVAILVVDIMHGIEPQTIESIQLLKDRKTPFIVALNKIDRLYGWQKNPTADVYNTMKRQTQPTKNDFSDRMKQVVAQFAMHEINVCLSCDNKNPDEYISLVPTSAHSGDGMGNLMAHICELSLRVLRKRLAFHEDLEATVMEVKEITGLGTTIDVCLVNGRLHEGDTIILAGQEGPIVTQIRGLLMPMPMKELRVKNSYEKFKELAGAQAVKIIAKDLEKSLAGLPLYSTKDADEIDVYKADVSAKLRKVLKSIEVQDTGVYVQASTLGSLEALLLFLRTEKIPYSGINIGPVHKRDVMKCSVMLEKDAQWAVILAFDVKVEREAQEMADSYGVKVFTADIIYHLSDAFMKWREERTKAEKDKYKDIAVFPCKLRVLPQFIFNSRDPIVCGVVVESGVVRVGTPLSVPSKECVFLGRVESLELNHRKVEEVRRGAEVCIKIAAPSGDAPKMYGRHFDHNDLIMSRVTRDSIDAVKQYFRDDLQKEDWKLMIELKKAFNVL